MKKLFLVFIIFFQSFCFGQIAGSIDLTYGNNGYADYFVTNNGVNYLTPEHAVEQSDGKVLISGYSALLTNQFVILRLLENGQIDLSYGNNGLTNFNLPSINCGRLLKMILQPDDKLLCSIQCNLSSGYYILRLNQDGSADNSFGQNGVYHYPLPTSFYIKDFSLFNNDKILISYGASNSLDSSVIRILNNGLIDNSFGDNGVIYSPANIIMYSVVYQQDGKFLAIIYEFNNYVIKRFNNDGTLDTTYLGNGYNLNTYSEPEILIQSDGKCLIKTGNSTYPTILFRFNINGSLDTSFGYNGIKSYDIPTNEFIAGGGFALQQDGKILVPGLFNDLVNFNGNNAMLRFNANGSIDISFGNNGMVLIRNSDQSIFYGHLIALQSGKILHMARYEYGQSNPANPSGRFTGFERFNSGVQLSNEKFEVNKTVKVSPNPSSSVFNLDLNNDLNNYKEIKIYDILGKLILNQNIENQNQVNIDLSEYESGYYLAKLQNDNYSIVVKLLKN